MKAMTVREIKNRIERTTKDKIAKFTMYEDYYYAYDEEGTLMAKYTVPSIFNHFTERLEIY